MLEAVKDAAAQIIGKAQGFGLLRRAGAAMIGAGRGQIIAAPAGFARTQRKIHILEIDEKPLVEST